MKCLRPARRNEGATAGERRGRDGVGRYPSSPAAVRRQGGLSLVEILISVTLGLILLAGIGQIFLGSKQTFNMGRGLARVQEDARFALSMIGADVRAAGYRGCADPNEVTPNVAAEGLQFADALQPPVLGFDDGTDPTGVATAAGTDAIAVMFASPESTQVTAPMGGETAVVTVDNTLGIESGDVVVISDCSSVDVFRVTNAGTLGTGSVDLEHGDSGNTSASLSASYSTNAQVRRLRISTYFVRDTGRTNAAGDPIWTLSWRDEHGAVEDLIEGVENLQILYGEQLSGGSVRYVAATAANAVDMNNVVGVRLGLLIATPELLGEEDDATVYNLAGSTVGPDGGSDYTHGADRRLRRAFNTTIQLRNQRYVE